MNFTINTHGNTWKNPKTRAAIGIGGVALALSIAIGGISSLPSTSSREASVTPQIQSQPVSAEFHAPDALGLGQPGERSTVAPQFVNMADAVSAQEQILVALAEGGYTVAASFPAEDALGLGQPGERSVVAPQFASMADAVSAQEQMLVALAEGGYTVVVPQFANMVDAWEASVR